MDYVNQNSLQPFQIPRRVLRREHENDKIRVGKFAEDTLLFQHRSEIGPGWRTSNVCLRGRSEIEGQLQRFVLD